MQSLWLFLSFSVKTTLLKNCKTETNMWKTQFYAPTYTLKELILVWWSVGSPHLTVCQARQLVSAIEETGACARDVLTSHAHAVQCVHAEQCAEVSCTCCMTCWCGACTTRGLFAWHKHVVWGVQLTWARRAACAHGVHTSPCNTEGAWPPPWKLGEPSAPWSPQMVPLLCAQTIGSGHLLL